MNKQQVVCLCVCLYSCKSDIDSSKWYVHNLHFTFIDLCFCLIVERVRIKYCFSSSPFDVCVYFIFVFSYFDLRTHVLVHYLIVLLHVSVAVRVVVEFEIECRIAADNFLVGSKRESVVLSIWLWSVMLFTAPLSRECCPVVFPSILFCFWLQNNLYIWRYELPRSYQIDYH